MALRFKKLFYFKIFISIVLVTLVLTRLIARSGNVEPPSIDRWNIRTLDEIDAIGERRFKGFGNGAIPRIVHITNKSPQLPIQYERMLRHCTEINPDVTFMFWDDEQSEKLLEHIILKHQLSKHSEESRWYKYLTTYSGIEKGDVIRLFLLYFVGGVYMDLDTECRQSFHQMHLSVGKFFKQKYRPLEASETQFSAVSCMLDQEQWVQSRLCWRREYSAMNNLMVCTPKHPFFRYVLENMQDNDKLLNTMNKTGPFMLTARYEEYNRLHNSKTSSLTNNMPEESIIELADPDWFSPLIDLEQGYEKLCEKNETQTNYWVKKGCSKNLPHYKATIDARVNASFLIHKFLHLGYDGSRNSIKETFHASTVPGVFLVQLP